MFAGRRPKNLGIRDGRLAACPAKPNCVCSQSDSRQHRIEPLKYSGAPERAMARLQEMVERMPRTSLIDKVEGYLYFQCASKLLGFVDDLEFYCQPEESCIHVRSASRLGYSDMGVNRKRVETIREEFEKEV